MTTLTTQIVSISLGLTFAFLIWYLFKFKDIGVLIGMVVAALIAIFVFGFTDEESRLVADYNSVLNEKPTCNRSSAECAIKYREWLDDSANARLKLNSVRDKLYNQIKDGLKTE